MKKQESVAKILIKLTEKSEKKKKEYHQILRGEEKGQKKGVNFQDTYE